MWSLAKKKFQLLLLVLFALFVVPLLLLLFFALGVTSAEMHRVGFFAISFLLRAEFPPLACIFDP